MDKILKMYCCSDCGTKISYNSAIYGKGLCKSCSKKGKRNTQFNIHRCGSDSSRYKDGRSLKSYFCKDCGKPITFHAGFYGNGRCKKCDGKNGSHRQTLNYCCKTCGGWISWTSALYGKGLCQKCYRPILHKILLERNKSGKESPGFIHGESNFPYLSDFNKPLKLKIRVRDNYKCQICDLKEKYNTRGNKKIKLIVHHIDYNKDNCDKSNLLCVCNSCHSKTNHNRDYWYAYCTYLMENR